MISRIRVNTLTNKHSPANTGYSPNAVSMLGQRQRRWPNIETTLSECYFYYHNIAFKTRHSTRTQ